jgi:hypothetical protein
MIDDEDINNVEAWAEVIKHMLHRVPHNLRGEILALASKHEEAARKMRQEGSLLTKASEVDFLNSPYTRHWHTIMRLKGLVVQVFARDIGNNHSAKEAADILFASYRYYGTGSGVLIDYLRDLLPHVGYSKK